MSEKDKFEKKNLNPRALNIFHPLKQWLNKVVST